MSKSFAILAMVYYLFMTVNQLTYLAVFQLSNFFAILNRISSVLRLEQYDKSCVKPDQANSKIPVTDRNSAG